MGSASAFRNWALPAALLLASCGSSDRTGTPNAGGGPAPFPAGTDKAIVAGTIVPPGTDLQHATAEIALYDKLVYDFPNVDQLSNADLIAGYFKDGHFNKGPFGREYHPRPDVLIQRTADYGVPIITGDSDAAAFFGAGYVAAEDRLVILEVLRALGKAEAFDLLGTAPAWLADEEMVRLYGYSDAELDDMITRAAEVAAQQAGPEYGALLSTAVTEYIAGINTYIAYAAANGNLPAFFTSRGITPKLWRRGDIVACTNVIRALFGAGGGDELNNAAVYLGLVRDFGETKARAIYEDFRQRDNRDGPVHTVNVTPYMARDASKLNPAANAMAYDKGDPGALNLLIGQLQTLQQRSRIRWENLKLVGGDYAVDLSSPGHMSNALIVGGSRTADGHPIMLAGPQTAYFSPEILLDEEVHSPSMDARGAGFPGLSFIPTIGRSRNYAWSATAGGSDMMDSFVEQLCEPDGSAATEQSRYYLHDGACLPMERRVIRTLDQLPVGFPIDSIPGNTLTDIIAERTLHGPVTGRGRIGDMPVAISHARSTFLREADGAVTLLRMARGEARTAQQFLDIFEPMNLTTNWTYVNAHEIAYHHGGLFPIRKAEVDPDFPVWGTGPWDWQGYMSPKLHPREANPKRDFFVSWNNRPAPGWSASDARWTWSSLHRGEMLERRIVGTREKITPSKLTQLMEDAGVEDFRGTKVASIALRLMARTAPPSPREAAAAQLLQGWIAHRAPRRDGDQDGNYDEGAAVAVMDAWYPEMIPAIFNPVLGDYTRLPPAIDNPPGLAGSAYENGWYGYVWSDLTRLLGEPLNSPLSRIYCGGSTDADGTVDRCANALWASFSAAIDSVAASQGDDMSAWTTGAAGERIRFIPGVVLSMHWVNRPTYQQLMEFGD